MSAIHDMRESSWRSNDAESHRPARGRGFPGQFTKSVHPDATSHGRGQPGSDYEGGVRPDDVTDEQLIERYRQGDRGSFRRLVERYHRELFHFLVRFAGNRTAAEDVFQETFLQVHQSASGFDVERRFRPWLFAIAANKARDAMRAQHRHPTRPLQASVAPGEEESGQFMDFLSGEGPGPGETLEKDEMAERVRSTVMEMPSQLREILLLSYFDQFPYNQISDILGIPLGTVKSRLHTAVADFASRWKTLNKSTPSA
jgi:RNA polymerase sigma-70 factor (ECF subfamily)